VENERCDRLAVAAAKNGKAHTVDTGYEASVGKSELL